MQDTTIPKKLSFIWFGNPMPAHLQDNIGRWQAMHPDWETLLWTESNVATLRNQALFDDAASLVPPDAINQFRADLTRYEILCEHGGFYADVDTYPLKRIDPELTGRDVFAAMEDQTWVGNTFLGCVPQTMLFADIITSIPESVRRNRGKRPNAMTGPKFLTPIWKRHHGYTAPTERFFPYSYSNVRNGSVPTDFGPEVVACHQWNHTTEAMERRKERGRAVTR
jgi:mannosyltransferase OCH1-like enzyme